MTIRPGPRLPLVLAGLCAGSLLVFAWPGVTALLMLSALIIAVMCWLDHRDARRRLADVTVSRQVASVVGRDRPFAVRWLIRRTHADSLEGELRECLPPDACPNFDPQEFRLGPNRFEAEIVREFRIPVRGEFPIGPLWLRVAGPFGLIEVQRQVADAVPIRVLPETYYSRDELMKDPRAQELLLDKPTTVRRAGLGTEFESLREFREGDDPRRIDWRATARQRHLIVRQYQLERHRDVMIVVDCGRLMGADGGQGSKLDCAIDSALMVARVALAGGDRCGLALFDDQVLGYLPPVNGLASLRQLADCVYNAQSRWRESDFAGMFATLQQRQSKRALLVILSDIVDAETSQRYRASLSRLTKRHVVLFAALRTPLLNQITHEPIDGDLALSRKAVVLRLLHERDTVLHSVRRCGIHVVDVEPSQLTIPLVNQFVQLRQQSLI